MLRKLLIGTALGSGLAFAAHAQDVKEVEMLHWWTSGGEAAALNVLKEDLSKQGFAWKDVPVAGGGGDAAMTALKAMVAAGNYPTASQMLGYTVLDYAAAGVMGDLTETAVKEGWDKSVPAALQKFSVY
ncbi:sugar ABC transporter substrate-binding protein, partial [Mesorhizobium sp. M7A.F.Ca.US.011.01.1.1]